MGTSCEALSEKGDYFQLFFAIGLSEEVIGSVYFAKSSDISRKKIICL